MLINGHAMLFTLLVPWTEKSVADVSQGLAGGV